MALLLQHPEDTLTDIVALRSRALDLLRLALNTNESVVRDRYLNVARRVLGQMEDLVDQVKSDERSRIDTRYPDETLELAGGQREGNDEIYEPKDGDDEDDKDDNEDNDVDDDEDNEEEGEDTEWGDEGDAASGEEEWDISNGQNDNGQNDQKYTANPRMSQYFINGPGGSVKRPQSDSSDSLEESRVKEDGTIVSNLKEASNENVASRAAQEHDDLKRSHDVRIYARLMELFEVESRRRMEICSKQQASHYTENKALARDKLAMLTVSEVVN